jgi:hypothetical protein
MITVVAMPVREYVLRGGSEDENGVLDSADNL